MATDKKKDHSFDYLNLRTSFVYNISPYKNGEEVKDIKSFANRTRNTPCFAKLFGCLGRYGANTKVKASIGIYMNADLETFDKNRINNLVVCNKDTVIRHIEMAKRVVDFDYRITKRTNYYVRIKMIGKPIQVKFICAWVRYLYEYPANVLMHDIYRLIDAGKFTEESIFNLVMALNTTLNTTSIRGDQCVKVNGKFQSEESLKKKLSDGAYYLERLYENRYYNERIRLNSGNKEEKSLNYWLDEDKLADRFLVYEKAVEKYKSVV